jgi:hypothetical protein
MDTTTQSTLIENNAAGVCRTVLDDAVDTVLMVGLSADIIDGLLTVLTERNDPPSIRILTAESVLKDLVSDFTIASTIADFIADDILSLRMTEDRLDGPLVLTEKRVIAIVSTETQTAGLATDEEEFVENARRHYADHWDTAESFTLRTPPLSRVQETMDEEFGSEMTANFEQMRTALGTDRGDGYSELDEVDICLLAAARNEALLYDISTWGEGVGIASRATFSRQKNRLEEKGLIETENVPIDIGRPRQRLLLGDERLREADADELVSVAGSILLTAGS